MPGYPSGSRIDAVLVWKFDRFARSTKEQINALEEFRALGVDFISYKQNIDTSTPAGKILFTIDLPPISVPMISWFFLYYQALAT